ncbi:MULTISPECIES: hypothetical protein [Cyanophyceae]|uniref:DUF697 domain-containing protein n=1 Tax=Plectonema cf. radiosum LEGE 06105 TaxID=945769 RepID=A0A8J7F1T2_9CYAN|nr:MULTISPECIES: hypothetical protein [Cyanophyceae]MBE9211340.1 hypothetical protein [Plectonema cf. radiosum LEGE 06105]MEA5570412.1 hypothetical protein [Calothrix sp. UHCC 0171]
MINSQRQEASSWVNGYTATAIGIVFAAAGIPGAGTVACIGIETTMCFHIGNIYEYEMTWEIARDHALRIGLATVLGKITALELATLTGPFAYVIKPAIAAPIIKALGEAVIEYYEEKCQ